MSTTTWRRSLCAPMSYASVCVLSFERLMFLFESLSTMRNAGFPMEVIVRDDGSADPDTRAWLVQSLEQGLLSQVILAPPSHNEGVGASFNKMAAIATGDPIIKADQDISYETDWLANVVRILEANAARTDEPLIGSMGLFRYWHEPVHHEKMLRERHDLWEEVDDYVSSVMVIRRAIWEAYGPWEEHSAAFAEDIGFKNRLKSQGFVHALPKVDLASNFGFGPPHSTVVESYDTATQQGTVREIHQGPYVLEGVT